MEIQYIRVGDYYIPDLTLPEETRPMGKWERHEFFWQISSAVVLWKGMENSGVLDVFPIYHTEVREQKIHSPAADELLGFS